MLDPGSSLKITRLNSIGLPAPFSSITSSLSAKFFRSLDNFTSAFVAILNFLSFDNLRSYPVIFNTQPPRVRVEGG
jgi:hypothetical protein